MSGPSDKARFYLERAVPQLQEFERKKIFTSVSFTYPVLELFPVPRRQVPATDKIGHIGRNQDSS